MNVLHCYSHFRSTNISSWSVKSKQYWSVELCKKILAEHQLQLRSIQLPSWANKQIKWLDQLRNSADSEKLDTGVSWEIINDRITLASIDFQHFIGGSSWSQSREVLGLKHWNIYFQTRQLQRHRLNLQTQMVWSFNKHQGFFGQFELLNKQKLTYVNKYSQTILKHPSVFNTL